MKKFLLAAIASFMIMNPAQAQNVEDAVQWAINIANDNTHGYSQGAENATAYNPYTGSRDAPDYDCSSLVYYAFNHAGFNIIDNWHKNPKYMNRYNSKQYVGDADTIWEDLSVDGGWKKFSWAEVADNLQRGDILCRPQFHVAIYIGDGKTVEARGVNNPTGLGRYETGDQGGEIDFYPAQGRGWTEVYRYVS
ncbi:MAG: C40 family peptidase [Selenomonadaceae bacterium]|nr:C40 family peptidase [Selenomonadaceae bacterium]